MPNEFTNQPKAPDQRDLAEPRRELEFIAPGSGSYDSNFVSRPIDTYFSLELAYTFFNCMLFNGELPACLITFQRTRSTYGYFSGARFVKVGDSSEVTDEIALNRAYVGKLSPSDLYATLVHEKTHLWQHHFGKPPRGRYHNLEWAAKMREIGLEPSDTGEPGGKPIGERISHYIVEGGAFDRACQAFLARETTLLYQDAAIRESPEDESAGRTRERKAASKTKYTCYRTGLNAWGKPGIRILCGCCVAEMLKAD